jgi:hypothetical protein
MRILLLLLSIDRRLLVRSIMRLQRLFLTIALRREAKHEARDLMVSFSHANKYPRVQVRQPGHRPSKNVIQITRRFESRITLIITIFDIDNGQQ